MKTSCLAKALAFCGVLLVVVSCQTDRPQLQPITLASTTDVGTILLVPDPAPPEYRPNRYQYIMPEDQQRRILSEAPKLRVGDSIESVIERLGPPLEEMTLSPKQPWGKPFGRSLMYYFAKRRLGDAIYSDPGIDLVFDVHGRLWTIQSNVPAIPDLNWPPPPHSSTRTMN